jgi:O-antigen/teichoic acid export membrane protein
VLAVLSIITSVRSYSNRRVNSSGIYFLVANFLSLALALVNFKLLTSVLNDRVLADYALLTTFQNFGTLILTGPLRVALVRYYSSALVDKLKFQFERFAALSMVVSAIILVLSGVVFSICLGMSTVLQLASIFLIIIYGILQDYLSFLAGCAIQLNKAKLAAVRIVVGKLSFTVGIALAFMIDRSPSAILIFSSSIIALILFAGFSLDEHSGFSFRMLPIYKSFTGKIYSFGWIFIVTGLISWAQLNMPRFFINWNFPKESVSKFYIISQISFLALTGFLATISQYLSPRLFRNYDENPDKLLSPMQSGIITSASLMLGLAFLGACTSLVAGDWIASLLSKKGISNVGIDLAIAFIAYGFYSAAQVMRIYGDQMKLPKKYLWINVVYPACAVLFTYVAAQISFTSIFVGLLLSETIHITGVMLVNKNLYNTKLKLFYERTVG